MRGEMAECSNAASRNFLFFLAKCSIVVILKENNAYYWLPGLRGPLLG